MARRLVLLLVVALVLAGATSPRRASAEGIATSLGPEDGNISALAQAPSQPSTLYAGTLNGGVFRSMDGGSPWTNANDGLSGEDSPYYFQPIDSLTVDPHDPLTVYAGGGFGLYESSDGGEHWHNLPFGPFATDIGIDPSQPQVKSFVADIAIDPLQPTVLYGAGFYCQCSPHGGLIFHFFISKSLDGGATWKPTAMDSTIYGIALNPSDPHIVYALMESGVSKSTDAGATWHTVGTAIPGSIDPSYHALSIASTTPPTLYVGLSHGVAKSSDDGKNWSFINAGLPIDTSNQVATVHNLLLGPGALDTIRAATDSGVYVSSDGGATWGSNGTGLGSVFTLAGDQTALYAGTSLGVYKSSDNGATWLRSIHGLTNSTVTTVLFDAATPTTVYAGTTRGMYVSRDSGTHWNIASTGLITGNVAIIVQEPVAPYRLYAVVRSDPLIEISSDLYTSSDSGENWALVTHIPDVFQALVLDPTTPTTLYASWIDGVYKSVDAGAHWTQIKQVSGIGGLAINPSAPDTILAGGQEIYKSVDGGTSWITTTQELADWSAYANHTVTTLLIDSHQPNMVYAATNTGIYISSDGGTSWHLSNKGLTPIPSITAITQDPNNPATMYVNVEDIDVFKSTNSGATWAADGSGLSRSRVLTLAVNPLDSTQLYAGTAGTGVFSIHQIDRPFSVNLPIITRT